MYSVTTLLAKLLIILFTIAKTGLSQKQQSFNIGPGDMKDKQPKQEPASCKQLPTLLRDTHA